MNDGIDPKILEFEIAGLNDRGDGRPNAYEALKAASSPYAEFYKRGWELFDNINWDDLIAIPLGDVQPDDS